LFGAPGEFIAGNSHSPHHSLGRLIAEVLGNGPGLFCPPSPAIWVVERAGQSMQVGRHVRARNVELQGSRGVSRHVLNRLRLFASRALLLLHEAERRLQLAKSILSELSGTALHDHALQPGLVIVNAL
jgi:hypothetical protein